MGYGAHLGESQEDAGAKAERMRQDLGIMKIGYGGTCL